MRISGDSHSLDWWFWLYDTEETLRVFLDGKEVSHVHMADDKAGEILAYVADESSGLVVDPARGDFVMQTLKGRVEIRGSRRETRLWPTSR